MKTEELKTEELKTEELKTEELNTKELKTEELKTKEHCVKSEKILPIAINTYVPSYRQEIQSNIKESAASMLWWRADCGT